MSAPLVHHSWSSGLFPAIPRRAAGPHCRRLSPVGSHSERVVDRDRWWRHPRCLNNFEVWVPELGVYAELLDDTEFQKIGKGNWLGKEKPQVCMLGAFGFAGQGRPWRKQRARPSPMPIASEGNDAPRGITSAASAVVFI
jgi:hypothetical protein